MIRSEPRSRLFHHALALAIGAALAPAAAAQETPAPASAGQQATQLDAVTVRGEYIPEPMAHTAEVASFVNREDLQRSGDSDAAAALARVSGLSVVGDRFVYVRGLGERYSSALFNGSPLPSPEPMQRVVPLDLFPSEALSGITVQKTYSVRYPGEFGGGVIDLRSLSVPEEPFLKLKVSIGGNDATTGERGLTYYGSDSDWWGYDSGRRDLPGTIVHSGQALTSANYDSQWLSAFGQALNNPNLFLLQQKDHIYPDAGFGASGGTAFELRDGLELGLVAVADFKNEWRTRTGKQQDGRFVGDELSELNSDYDFTATRDNARVNGLLGLGLRGERHSLAWNTLYVHDTLKQAKSRHGYDFNVGGNVRDDGTLWLERQLLNHQLSGTSSFGEYDDLKMEWRLAASRAKRETPYETSIRYYEDADGAWAYSGGSTANSIKFGAVNDDMASGGVDFEWRLPIERELTLSFGAAYSDNDREAVQRTFRFAPVGALPAWNQYQRIDYLFSDANFADGLLTVQEITPNNAGESAYKADLRVKAAYLQLEGEILPAWRASLGLRYEDATQAVHPFDIFSGERVAGVAPLKNDNLLPALTVIWNFADNRQLRLGASRTLARPQFRELAPQQYYDPDNDRLFAGNPYLVDSKLTNLDLRYEWFFGAGEYFTAGVFHKNIDHPVEAAIGALGGNQLFQGFLNAPRATLYGAELEFKKYFDPDISLSWWGDSRLYLASNYTWTQSEVHADAGDTLIPPTFDTPQAATSFVRDGSRMQGQSEHIANLQLGVESEQAELQATVIANYVSERIVMRGLSGQPDYVERPGTGLDLVLNKGLPHYRGMKPSLKFSARNLLDTRHREFQERAGQRIELYGYDPGISWDLSLTVAF